MSLFAPAADRHRGNNVITEPFEQDEAPLRGELFSIEQLERHARELAKAHRLTEQGGRDRLLSRLHENEQVLIETYDLFVAAVKEERRTSPAAEWLLDNFYIIEEQIRMARRHLPRSYSQELPRLATGPYAGEPRVHGLALELISHTDGGVDAASVPAFIRAYQQITPLKLGELWAVAIMLRLALIENLRRLAVHLARNQIDRDAARSWGNRIVQTVERDPSDLILVLADLARANPPQTTAFYAEIVRHLHGNSPHFVFGQSWLEHRLAGQGMKISQILQIESRQQAADQVTIGNIITSLRFVTSTDWKEFVDTHSVVEEVLRSEPAGVYPRMDFASRDQYRHIIEEIAKHCPLSEQELAQRAVQLAENVFVETPQDRTAHVGYYLIDKGRPALEGTAGVRRGALMVAVDSARRHPLVLYLGGIALLTTATLWWLARLSPFMDIPTPWIWLMLTLTALMATQFAVGVVNWLITLFVAPRPLAKIDLQGGIPAESRTMVVVPTMLTSLQGAEDLIDGLEIRYLANRDKHLHFALLTDFKDAPQMQMPGDEALVERAAAGIRALNTEYAKDGIDIFYLFHRPRRWNPAEGIWMGYERKRGKLMEFNTALSGGSRTAFSTLIGNVDMLPRIKYVITLDTDTQLPRDAAHHLVGAMSHPLNRPVFDPGRGRVVEGYGILQPRVAVSLPSASKSWFVRLFAADAGLDPYTRVTSDIYQDLFHEGSFVGKGIYDVKAFERACELFPENAILSHDLLEGTYARSGLITDVELFEDYPSRYLVDASRRKRWIRGDWQIGWWLLPRVPAAGGKWLFNPISGLSVWKIFDNLRRSLVTPATVLLLLAAWLAPWPGVAMLATLLVIGFAALPLILPVLVGVFRKPMDLPVTMHLRAIVGNLGRAVGQIIFGLATLPFDASTSLDAIGRTLIRVLISHKHMLEWTTSTEAERNAATHVKGIFRTMWTAPAVGLGALLLVTIFEFSNVGIAAPLIALWLISPFAAWLMSRTLKEDRPEISATTRAFLGRVSRQTWHYFETFVTAEHNWLPPDNYQEAPRPVVASRTSPTNIGLALLANISAVDFGYCSMAEALRRTQATLSTMASMEKYRGHLYNWYETTTLKPLAPLYVSSVDSGNMAAHLLVLRQGLLEGCEAPCVSPRVLCGLVDTMQVFLEMLRKHSGAHKSAAEAQWLSSLGHRIAHFERECEHQPTTLSAIVRQLDRAIEFSRETHPPVLIMGEAEASLEPADEATQQQREELRWWEGAIGRQAQEQRDELLRIAPWANNPVLQAAGEAGDEKLHALQMRLDALLSPHQIAELTLTALPQVNELLVKYRSSPLEHGLGELRDAILAGAEVARERIRALREAAEDARELADMDFTFLFDSSRELFAIGYNVNDHRLDAGFYDLLASEARLASYFAIAQGQIGQQHWFALGRLLTSSAGAPALLSWSGSMFEYLMPLLVMPTYENTLLNQTYRAVVKRQIDYGRQRGVPWGISESAYNTTDVHLNFQYRAFGVPGLGLKRGLADDLVIAPYATVMALMVAPDEACRNLERLESEGALGRFGFYEALDYTPARLPRGAGHVTIRSYFAHHEGMSLLSLAYLLLDRPMQARFDADPALRATSLLLHERVPRASAPVFPHATEASVTQATSSDAAGTVRVLTDMNGPLPDVHLLSNGRYHVMLTSAGGGYSRWHDFAVTRWREDSTRDNWGSFCYLRDAESGHFWSLALQPTLKPSDHYEAIFTEAKAEFRRRDEGIDTHTEISVSPEDDIEIRRVTITNHSDRQRLIEVTSYAEAVLAMQAQDLAHPGFSNLFVQTELIRERDGIFCTRRARSSEEKPPWMVHLMTVLGVSRGETSFETDRSRFIGRGRTLANPLAMESIGYLNNSAGPVLDPIVSIRRLIWLKPNESARVDILTGMAATRATAEALLAKYQDRRMADRVTELAWTHNHVELRRLNATEAEAQLYARLAASIIYGTSVHRSAASVLARNRRAQSGLWGHGISGDLPIMLVRIRTQEKLDLVRQAIQAHSYWRIKGLKTDLVIWNEDDSVYRQSLQDTISGLIAAGLEPGSIDQPGGIFVRRGEQLPEEDRLLLLSIARVVMLDDAGTFRDQVERRGHTETRVPLLRVVKRTPDNRPAPTGLFRELQFYNGMGGFTNDGREYVTRMQPGQATPAPWCNVLANPEFGTVVSESGSEYTWTENSHEFRLTPWSNDPISGGSGGEGLYIRDESNGRFWSPSPAPARGVNIYTVRHGFGYSIFEYEEEEIVSELTYYVAIDNPVKFVRLKLINRSGSTRDLSITHYCELVLGELRSKMAMHTVTELDPTTGAIFARNSFNSEFSGQIVFADASEINRTITADRREFIGRNGTLAEPAAMGRVRLSGRVGSGIDPCAAIQIPLRLAEGEEREIVFLLGAAGSEDHARHLIQRYRTLAGAQQALEGVWHYWNRTLGVVYLETPDAQVNFLANGWLIYQTLACRMWARTGFYQSGGAFGFRDQLQDAMALIHAAPTLLRAHLLRAAARQFSAGDVQHWWHLPSGRGVRTHFSDDFLWLPYATCRYIKATGDTGVLQESVHFLDGRPLRAEEESYYDLPQISDEVETLYEHCKRAVKHGLRFGSHGLPLIGCGDWNDGMNLIGKDGKGESVWLAFFLYEILTEFADIARTNQDVEFADKCLNEAGLLRRHIEDSAWDGAWYRRAYFDDGEPLGSAQNTECQIDALPQSWAVLSGAGDLRRAEQAMESVNRRLVRRDSKLIQLFDPPFDKSHNDPGYIKGYIPGVRENGGQYTHAAIWTIMAFAKLGDTARAWELFRMINPIEHGKDAESVAVYKVEPYIVAADVYAVAPHIGRGGWTWYTGSAGWMYRLMVESLIGLNIKVDVLSFTPCLPPEWKEFKMHYRFRETFYHIIVKIGEKGRNVNRITLDGVENREKSIKLVDDFVAHEAVVELD